MAEEKKKTKRKEPLPEGYENPHKKSSYRKDKKVTVWKYTRHWLFWKYPNTYHWTKLRRYHSEKDALQAIQQDMVAGLHAYWFNEKRSKEPIPFYWIGDTPPEDCK